MRFCTIAIGFILSISFSSYAVLDLSQATIIPVPNEGITHQAAVFLQEEIAERSGVTLTIADSTPSGGARIVIGTVDQIDAQRSVVVPARADSFGLKVIRDAVMLVGRDNRGMMYSAGHLIRNLTYTPGRITLDQPDAVFGRPEIEIRAHQLGYRNTANTYDAWTIDMFEDYIRDLILFGTNGIELIPSLDPMHKDGPVMQEPIRSMNVKIAQILKNYGLDVWLWSAVMDNPNEDVTTPEGINIALEKRRALFQAYPSIDHFFVPGGDDGDAPAEALMPFLKQLAAVLHEYHPNAKMWVSNQTFTIQENNYFFDYLASEESDWLHGVVYGPWTKMSWEQLRERTPERYPIRRYPDINHTVRCQYPIPNWDPIFAHTVGREPIMPLPEMHQHIYKRYRGFSKGFATYSDGIHDDFNKVLWSVLGWDRDTEIDVILNEYGKLWWGEELSGDVAKGLSMLEKNWQGAIVENETIPKTLALWEDIARRCSDYETNWRMQMYLFRARFDAHVKSEALAQGNYQEEAHAILAQAQTLGVQEALTQAHTALAQANQSANMELRTSLETLGKQLHKSIGYQFSILEPYLARNPERGAMLDWLDQSLNDRPWLEQRFKAILAMKSEADQLTAIDEILHWTDPGPGGFYDNLGAINGNSHVVYQDSWENDPSGSHSPRVAFPYYKADPETIAKAEIAFEGNNTITAEEKAQGRKAFSSRQELRLSWQSQMATHYGTPLKLRYENLDKRASYRLKVTYAGRYRPTMTLTVDDTIGIHGPIPQPNPIWPVEYDIPKLATQDGTLDIEWNLVDGRGCMVAEVWLMKQ